MSSSTPDRFPSVMLSQGAVSRLRMREEKPEEALIVLGCPEVPVQQALSLYTADRLNDDGWRLTITGNPAVLNLLRVSDPKKVYIRELVELERCIDELSSGGRIPGLAIVFVHSDAGISYASTIRFLLSGRVVACVFGRDADTLAAELADIFADHHAADPVALSELVVDPAVHNPGKIRRKLDLAMGWAR
ncbi:MAG: DUF1890 domain-containing protein [Methanocalculus sp. MSAO_Arc2]|nr:MAG: DUF1890 domain-containing protein [Methanocalculus sp. MSAO_Arc2]